MLAQELASLRNHMQRDGIMFCFSGYMTEEVLTGIGGALKKKLEVEDTNRNTSKSLFSIFVELVQNVIRYSAEGDHTVKTEDDHTTIYDLRYGVLTVGRNEGRYFVSCGNLIRPDDANRLSDGLAHIQSLDKEGLKSLYKETLRAGPPEGSKGAGVGFVEIARRASHGFEYDFEPVDGDRTFFALKAYL